jgi:hypothetical protein
MAGAANFAGPCRESERFARAVRNHRPRFVICCGIVEHGLRESIMDLPLRNLALSGYRSFGATIARFPTLGKINILIGRNNSGKSNVIRFLCEAYPRSFIDDSRHSLPKRGIDPLEAHQPGSPPLLIGMAESVIVDSDGCLMPGPLTRRLFADGRNHVASMTLARILQKKAALDGTTDAWSMMSEKRESSETAVWHEAFNGIDNTRLCDLWSAITKHSGGDRHAHWEPELIRRLLPPLPIIHPVLIPAVREIRSKQEGRSTHDGTGLIESLNELQHPDVQKDADRALFNGITVFLRSVIDRPTAEIEIPHHLQTINVRMDGKILPLSSLGSGVHEVIILAATATVVKDSVVCIEEPELHLNPVLQRKLMRYLADNTSNQYVITTHSAALMDTPGAEIYHVRLVNGESVIERATSSAEKSAVCEDLGYHPSDLLQANCIIWVEGPSDRIYIQSWLSHLRPDFIEGIHFSIMFYGGRLASHLSYAEDEKLVDGFISLCRLNRRGVIVIDSDRKSKNSQLNATKQRLQAEFDKGPGHAWITDGREIENYLPREQVEKAISHVRPSAQPRKVFKRYDKYLEITSSGSKKKQQAPKVEVARNVVKNFAPPLGVLGLQARLDKLIQFIEESNPTVRS